MKGKHLLNYDILQDWGFEWTYLVDINDEKVARSYFLAGDKMNTDYHRFCNLYVSFLPSPNGFIEWNICRTNRNESETLFRGKIDGDDSLETILKSVLIFKPEL